FPAGAQDLFHDTIFPGSAATGSRCSPRPSRRLSRKESDPAASRMTGDPKRAFRASGGPLPATLFSQFHQVRVQQLELNGILNLPKHLFADLLSRQGLSEPAGSDSLRIRIPDKRRAVKHVKQDRVRGLRPDPSDLKQPAAKVGGVFR